MTASNSDAPKILAAMVAVRTEVGHIGKTKKMTDGPARYEYRGIDPVLAGIHHAINKHGIVHTPRVQEIVMFEPVTSKSGTAGYHAVVVFEWTFWCAEDGSSIVSSALGESIDYSDKAGNKAFTAAQKYSLCGALSIPTGEPEADDERPEAPPPNRTATPPATPPSVERLMHEMAALNDGDVDEARAEAVAIAAELGMIGRWAEDPDNVNRVILTAHQSRQNPTNQGGGPETAPKPEAASASDVEAEQWSNLYALLDKDPILGTVEDIEQRTRQLFMLMRGVGVWPDRIDDSGNAVDELHWRLMTDHAVEHWSALGRKANYQKFAKAAWVAATEAVDEHSEGDEDRYPTE